MHKLFFLVAPILAFAWSCGIECGPGTLEMDGTCVGTDSSACGPGTKLEGGQCVPEVNVKCGPQTMLVGNECRPDGTIVTCAPGTQLVNNQCIPSAEACGPGTTLDATGVCIPDGTIVCGAGTIPNGSGMCVPDPNTVCQPGTTYDPSTGSCAPDVTCRPGEVAVGGVCLTPEEIDASNADLTETLPDDNDPVFGGTPEMVPVPAIGDSTIFTGGIGAPQDLDGDARPDQDWDHWSFTAAEGDTFEIVLRSLGSASLGFVVLGPNGYARQSPLYFVTEPARHIIAPYAGTYTIAVAPQIRIENLTNAGPEGGDDHEYVVILEHEAFPSRADLAPGGAATGAFGDLLDNAFLIRSTAGDLLRLEIATQGADATPVLLTFDPSMRLVAEITSLPTGTLVHRSAANDDLIVVFDYARLVGTDEGFSIASVIVIPIDVGAVPPDGTLTSVTSSIAPGDTGYFSATITAGQIVEASVAGGANPPSLRAIGPDGRLAASAPDSRGIRFYAGLQGRYTVEVASNDVVEDVFAVTFTSITPVALGIAALSSSTAAWGDVPSMDNAYFVVDALDPMQLTLTAVQTTNANLSLIAYDTSFVVRRIVDFGGVSPSLSMFVAAPSVVIVEIFDNSPGTALGVSLDAVSSDLPPLEVEPNDVLATATPLALDTLLYGEAEEGDDDYFRISLAQALAPDEILEVRVLDASDLDDYTCQLQNGTGAILEEQTPRRLGCVVFASGLAAGDYGFRVQKANPAVRVYQVIARIIAGVEEVEPNDVEPGTTIAMGAAPTYGEVAINTDPDIFTFTLASALPATTYLEVLIDTVGTNPTQTMQAVLQGPGGLNTTFAINPSGSTIRAGLGAGDYRITVSRTSANTVFDGHYRITLSQNTIGVTDTEPNNAFGTAQALGAAPASAAGFIAQPTTGDDDFYSFTLASDLAATEAVVVRMFRTGANPTQAVRVSLFDGNQTLLGSNNMGDPRIVAEPGAVAGTYYVRADATFNTTIDTSYIILVTIE
jgi:hypothetical protein